MMRAISSKREPISVPLPAITSNRTVVFMPGNKISFKHSTIYSMPWSTPCSTWLPGWKLYIWPGKYSMRSKSSFMDCLAKARKSSFAAHGLYVYGAWANKVPKLCSFIYAPRLFISSKSIARIPPPRGLRVKYWNVLPPILVASFPIFK